MGSIGEWVFVVDVTRGSYKGRGQILGGWVFVVTVTRGETSKGEGGKGPRTLIQS